MTLNDDLAPRRALPAVRPEPRPAVVAPARFQREIREWLSGQPAVSRVVEVSENSPGAGLFTGLTAYAELAPGVHAAAVADLVTGWAAVRGKRNWTLSLGARVAIILDPGSTGSWVGDAWAYLMADERLSEGSALAPRVSTPGATVVLRTDGAALPVLWHHLDTGRRELYRPRRAITPSDSEPAELPAVPFNVEVQAPGEDYRVSGHAELLLACRPALEGLTAAADGARIEAVFGSESATVTVSAETPRQAEAVRRTWDRAGVPEGATLEVVTAY
ncbi:hypothetical protein [Granulicoccus phenolivorans]|uniref:hypothetical protein n=1 Tax=Granulicoccus phenolivorans TaxID=266854 RepID=UPI0003FFE26B|nr:hypothetical protein [Granulicoccus phenolivorans]